MKYFKNNRFTAENSIETTEIRAASEMRLIFCNEERLEKIKTLCYN